MKYRRLCCCVYLSVHFFVIVSVFWIRGRWCSAGGEQIIGFRSKGDRGESSSTCLSPCTPPSYRWIIHYPCSLAALGLDRMVLRAHHELTQHQYSVQVEWYTRTHCFLSCIPQQVAELQMHLLNLIQLQMLICLQGRSSVDLIVLSFLSKQDYKATETSRGEMSSCHLKMKTDQWHFQGCTHYSGLQCLRWKIKRIDAYFSLRNCIILQGQFLCFVVVEVLSCAFLVCRWTVIPPLLLCGG